MAVKRLRDDLGLTRDGLATAVRHHLEPGMIYRWESGKNSPSPEWRKFLAAFARRRGCFEAAAAFEEPVHEWKMVMLSADERRLLTLFEIVLLNKPAAPDAWSDVLPWKTYRRLVRSLEDAAGRLKNNQGRKFQINGQTTNGTALKSKVFSWGATTLTEEQRETWLRETNPRAKKAIDEQRDGAVVIRYNDGRVDVQKDEESASGRAKS